MEVIRNDIELRKALQRADDLWTCKKDSSHGDEFEVIITLISDYEDSIIFNERTSLSEIMVNMNDL